MAADSLEFKRRVPLTTSEELQQFLSCPLALCLLGSSHLKLVNVNSV